MSLSKNFKETRIKAITSCKTDDPVYFSREELFKERSKSDHVTTNFILAMKNFLHNPMSISEYRINPTDFTRKRCFTLPRLAIAILKEHSRPIQTKLIHVFQDGGFNNLSVCPTASAFSQARSKLQPAFFKEWTSEAVNYFYDHYPGELLVSTWHGRYLWAIDCSTLTLPDTPETRKLFTVTSNQFPNSKTVLGQASLVFDVLNELPVNACLGKIQSEANYVIESHSKQFNPFTVAIYDRVYTDYAIVATHANTSSDFVIRCRKTQTFKIINEFLENDATDKVYILQVPKNKRPRASANGWSKQVQVRLIKIMLDNGEIEVLMTSLLDQVEFPAVEFKWLYGMRWGVETAFFRFKHQLEVECFSSKKIHNIEQEFHGSIFLQAFESILNKVQDHSMRVKSKEKKLKYVYRVNKSGAFTVISDHIVGLFLLDNEDLPHHLIAYQKDISRNKSLVRPGRRESRPNLTPTKRLNYHLYRKKRR